MTKKEERIRRKELHQLLDLVLDINGIERRNQDKTGNKPTAFFEFSGHVCNARIHIYKSGWSNAEDVRMDYNKVVYFSDDMYDKNDLLPVVHNLENFKSNLEIPQL